MLPALCILMAAAAPAALCANPDSEGHILVREWKDYSAARSADRPVEEEAVLDRIIVKALDRSLAWDFCDAAVRWYSAVTRRNWKQRDSAMTRISEDVGRFGNPLVTYRMSVSGLTGQKIDMSWFDTEFMGKAGALKKECNSVFYGNDPWLNGSERYFPFIASFISNDYEYMLWSLSRCPGYGVNVPTDNVAETAETLLDTYLQDSYPGGAVIEYLNMLESCGGSCGFIARQDEGDRFIDRNLLEKRKAALDGFSAKYDGKAAGLLARAQIIMDRKAELDAGLSGVKGAPEPAQADYRSLREECISFEKLRKSFSGDEKKIASGIDNVEILLKELDSRSIRIEASDHTVKAYLRNVRKADLQVRKESADGETIFSSEVSSSEDRYYIMDTVECRIPDIPDGDYCIICASGDVRTVRSYGLRSLSLAGRDSEDGYGIYAAMSAGGEPVASADVRILSRGRTVKTVEDFTFSGFTSIEDILDSVAVENGGALAVQCSVTDSAGVYRMSPELYVHNDTFASYGTPAEVMEARVFLDRSAFTPGDTVHFKSVLYSRKDDGRGTYGFHTAAEGYGVRAVLSDSEGGSAGELDLHANSFGSVSGSFAIPDNVRGGTFSLGIRSGDRTLGSVSFTVDEFVLPSYELSFDPDDALHFTGDTVSVKGRVESYSGHPLSSAMAEYEISSYVYKAVSLGKGRLFLGADGRFDIRFVPAIPGQDSLRSFTCRVNVRITGLTGETFEWGRSININPDVSLDITLENPAEGDISAPGYAESALTGSRSASGTWLMSGDTASVYVKAGPVWGDPAEIDTDVSYTVAKISYDGREDAVLEGRVRSGSSAVLDFSGQPSGMYLIRCSATFRGRNSEETPLENSALLYRSSQTDAVIEKGVGWFFRKLDDGSVSALAGAGDGRQWYVIEIFDSYGHLLKSDIAGLEGMAGEEGSVTRLEYGYSPDWTNEVTMNIFGFKNGGSRSQTFRFRRPVPVRTRDLPLEFTRFVDRSLPGTTARFTLRTMPDVECLVSVFDKSTERIRKNVWTSLYRPYFNARYVYIYSESGYDGGFHNYFMDNAADLTYGIMMKGRAEAVAKSEASGDVPAALPEQGVYDDGSVPVRDRFDETLAFIPYLRPDEEGRAGFSVDVTDKLSTYYVSVYAHGRDMEDAVLRQEMEVSLPVEVSVSEPLFLYSGDTYVLRASVSNSSGADVVGTLSLYAYLSSDYDGTAPFIVKSVPLTVGSGAAACGDFKVDVPETDTLGLRIVFNAGIEDNRVSDAVFVPVPVYGTEQVLTEAHSSVLSPDMDRDSLRQALTDSFTGTSGYGAEYRETSLMDMLMESVPGKTVPASDNVLDLTEAMYMRLLSEYILTGTVEDGGLSDTDSAAGELEKRILACRNPDGGFGWFEGFRSSPVVTAVVLERFSDLRDRGLYSPSSDIAESVRYLDSLQFRTDIPSMYGPLSLDRYLYVRSRFPDVIFSPSGEKYPTKAARSRMKDFSEDVRDYLLPRKARGLDGNILAKARRVFILEALSAPESRELALAAGLKKRDFKRLLPSAVSDILSLKQYAVKHPSGGIYFPNAVMPFKGLLESEVYAHSVLCDLMSDREPGIADGIRLWLMVQKETQHWEADPAYLNAVCSVLDGSESVKKTRIAVMTKKYAIPFSDIQAAGNGMTVERVWYRIGGPSAGTEVRRPLACGDSLEVGERIQAEYRIWSGENRSFVRLVSPYYAAVRPVSQLSGRTGGWFRPVSFAGNSALNIIPCGYREVKSDRTVYYFDVCPEENTVFTEEFHVTQSGTFTAPAVTVECMYSPHYRANGAASGQLETFQVKP